MKVIWRRDPCHQNIHEGFLDGIMIGWMSQLCFCVYDRSPAKNHRYRQFKSLTYGKTRKYVEKTFRKLNKC